MNPRHQEVAFLNTVRLMNLSYPCLGILGWTRLRMIFLLNVTRASSSCYSEGAGDVTRICAAYLNFLSISDLYHQNAVFHRTEASTRQTQISARRRSCRPGNSKKPPAQGRGKFPSESRWRGESLRQLVNNRSRIRIFFRGVVERHRCDSDADDGQYMSDD